MVLEIADVSKLSQNEQEEKLFPENGHILENGFWVKNGGQKKKYSIFPQNVHDICTNDRIKEQNTFFATQSSKIKK